MLEWNIDRFKQESESYKNKLTMVDFALLNLLERYLKNTEFLNEQLLERENSEWDKMECKSILIYYIGALIAYNDLNQKCTLNLDYKEKDKLLKKEIRNSVVHALKNDKKMVFEALKQCLITLIDWFNVNFTSETEFFKYYSKYLKDYQ